MNNDLTDLINNFKKDRRLSLFDEAATKQAVIMRILKNLGWDPFNIDEVHPEYSVGGKRVDYALKYKGKNKVFIEVKKISEDLEKHQEQLLNYSFKEGVKLAILTNGISWWFYLPLHEGSWEQRKFYTIELYDQETDDIVDKFEQFLSKRNVISDKAIENAEKIYKSKQKQFLTKETFPRAWKKIILEPDELLVELLAETTEKLCGYKPDNRTVELFLKEISKTLMPPKRGANRQKPAKPNSSNSYLTNENYSGKSIIAFTFKGTSYKVKSWKEMLIKICNIILSSHRKQFNKVLNLVGRKRPYFTKNPNELRRPEEIDDTGIYVETNLSTNSIVKLTKDILITFGYGENDLKIEIK